MGWFDNPVGMLTSGWDNLTGNGGVFTGGTSNIFDIVGSAGQNLWDNIEGGANQLSGGIDYYSPAISYLNPITAMSNYPVLQAFMGHGLNPSGWSGAQQDATAAAAGAATGGLIGTGAALLGGAGLGSAGAADLAGGGFYGTGELAGTGLIDGLDMGMGAGAFTGGSIGDLAGAGLGDLGTGAATLGGLVGTTELGGALPASNTSLGGVGGLLGQLGHSLGLGGQTGGTPPPGGAGFNWSGLLGPGIAGLADYVGNTQIQQALQPDMDARRAALEKYRQFLLNPKQAYMQDPALLELRQQRMDDIRSRQLARTGGESGGAYARQLMKEGSAFDENMLNTIGNRYSNLLASTQAPLSAYLQAGGSALGAGASAASQAANAYMSDQRFNQLLARLTRRVPTDSGTSTLGGATGAISNIGSLPIQNWWDGNISSIGVDVPDNITDIWDSFGGW